MTYYSHYEQYHVNLSNYFAAVKPEPETDLDFLSVELPSGDVLWCNTKGDISVTESDLKTPAFIEYITGEDIKSLYRLCKAEGVMS